MIEESKTTINRNSTSSAADVDDDNDSEENDQVMVGDAQQQHSFLGERFEQEKVTIEEAFERVGGFGKF